MAIQSTTNPQWQCTILIHIFISFRSTSFSLYLVAILRTPSPSHRMKDAGEAGWLLLSLLSGTHSQSLLPYIILPYMSCNKHIKGNKFMGSFLYNLLCFNMGKERMQYMYGNINLLHEFNILEQKSSETCEDVLGEIYL